MVASFLAATDMAALSTEQAGGSVLGSFSSRSCLYLGERPWCSQQVLVMNLFRARWCGSLTGPKYSFLVIKWSRKGSGIHLNYTVGSQANRGPRLNRWRLRVLNLHFIFKIRSSLSQGWGCSLMDRESTCLALTSPQVPASALGVGLLFISLPWNYIVFIEEKYSKIDWVRHCGTLCSKHPGVWGRRIKLKASLSCVERTCLRKPMLGLGSIRGSDDIVTFSDQVYIWLMLGWVLVFSVSL